MGLVGWVGAITSLRLQNKRDATSEDPRYCMSTSFVVTLHTVPVATLKTWGGVGWAGWVNNVLDATSQELF